PHLVHVLYNQAPNMWNPSYAGLADFYFNTLAYQRGIPVATSDKPGHDFNPTYFEGGPTAIDDNDFHETYVSRLIGLLQINADVDYRFACSSDDGGPLFLSTDDKPAHKNQIAREPQWAGTREWTGAATSEGGRQYPPGRTTGDLFENVSDPIHLL